MRKMRMTDIVTMTIHPSRNEQGSGHKPRVAVLLARMVPKSLSIMLLRRLAATHPQFSYVTFCKIRECIAGHYLSMRW